MTDIPALLIDTLRLGASPTEDRAAKWHETTDSAVESLVGSEGAGSWLYSRWRDGAVNNVGSVPYGSRIRALAMAELGMTLRVEDAAVEALAVLKSAGFEVVLLKGLAYRAAAREVPYLDARSTMDVDLLVAPSDAEPAWQALRRAGFVAPPPPDTPKPAEHHHLEGLWSDRRIAVELHTSTSSSCAPIEAWRRMRGGAVTRTWNGMNVLVPSATELLWHAVEHSFTHDAAGFTLRQFLPGAALMAAGAPIDTDLIQHRIAVDQVREGNEGRFATSVALTRWLEMAGALATTMSIPTLWRGGYDHLWRLLSWRLRLLRQFAIGSRMYPYLREQGTRAEAGLGKVPSSASWSARYRAQYFILASLSRLAYGLLKPRRAG